MSARSIAFRVVGAMLAVFGILVVSQQQGGITMGLLGGIVMIGLGAVLVMGGDGS